MSEVAVAQNYLEACQAWQEVISAQPTIDAKEEAGQEALLALANQTFYSDRRVIVSGATALYLPDKTGGLEEKIWPYMQFGEICTRGWLGRLNYIQMRDECFLDWTVYDPSIIGPAQEIEIEAGDETAAQDPDIYRLPLDKMLRRPLHFPVNLINYALCYKK
jgi:hypothetical protein